MTRRPLLGLLMGGASSMLLIAGCSNTAGSDTAITGGAWATLTPATTGDSAPTVPGMVIYASMYPAAETVTRVQGQVNSVGKVAATVDFATAAQSIGKQLRPTIVIIGASPKAGTPIMAADQRAAIDLPQKYLVWQAAGGTVFLGYNSADYIAERAGIDPSDPAINLLRAGSAAVAAKASGSTAALANGDSPPAPGPYLVEQISNATVADSIARYEAAFAAKNQPTIAIVDHGAAAEDIGMSLRPTETTFLGNATVSTALVGAQQTMGIDLPVRYAAWQDQLGLVHVAHPDIRALAARHQVTGEDAVLDMVTTAADGFNDAAASGAG